MQPLLKLYLCFDRDDAGRRGALHVGQSVPHAKIVDLPDDVGAGGDITDFFVRLGRTREEFLQLLDAATPVPVPPATLPVATTQGWSRPLSDLNRRIAKIKQGMPVADLVNRYVPLRPSGKAQRGRCPFHEDHSPSLMVYPESGSYHCFGCGAHGDIISFIAVIEHLPFFRALDRLEEIRKEYDQPTREAA